MLDQWLHHTIPAATEIYRKSSRKSAAALRSRAVLMLGLGLVFGGVPALAHAQARPGTLYGAGAPEDAAFVRVFNYRGTGEVSRLWIGATEFRSLGAAQSSAYRPVTPEIHMIYLNDNYEELIARTGSYYTVLLLDQGLVVLEDPAHTRADLAQIQVYNLGFSSPVELRTEDGEIPVVQPVAAWENGVVAVNPVAVELAVFIDGRYAVSVGDLGLARGQSYAVFVMQDKGGPAVVVEQAQVLPN